MPSPQKGNREALCASHAGQYGKGSERAPVTANGSCGHSRNREKSVHELLGVDAHRDGFGYVERIRMPGLPASDSVAPIRIRCGRGAAQLSRSARRRRTRRRTPHTTARTTPATAIHGSRNPRPTTIPFSGSALIPTDARLMREKLMSLLVAVWPDAITVAVSSAYAPS